MKHFNRPLVPVMLLLTGLLLAVNACSTIKREFSQVPNPPAPGATNQPDSYGPPPASQQLDKARPIVQALVPEPYGTLISGGMALASAAIAAYAASHSRAAAASSAAASEQVSTMTRTPKG